MAPRIEIRCSWCGQVVKPNAARMRMFESETIRISGQWLAHFHPECGDAVLDICELNASGVFAGSHQDNVAGAAGPSRRGAIS